jgi:hypothetical protein
MDDIEENDSTVSDEFDEEFVESVIKSFSCRLADIQHKVEEKEIIIESPAKPKVKLITSEESAVGAVSWSIYRRYFKSLGFGFILMVLLVNIFSQCSAIGANGKFKKFKTLKNVAKILHFSLAYYLDHLGRCYQQSWLTYWSLWNFWTLPWSCYFNSINFIRFRIFKSSKAPSQQTFSKYFKASNLFL